jgi:hypothetical protein
MSEWIGIGVIALVLALGLLGLSRIAAPYSTSVEEFEKRASEGPGLFGASLSGLQKALEPAAERAANVVEDLKQGHLDGEQESGDDLDNEENGIAS